MFWWVRLGYFGGWGRGPAARQARGPSAAARQGVQTNPRGGGYINIHFRGKRKIPIFQKKKWFKPLYFKTSINVNADTL